MEDDVSKEPMKSLGSLLSQMPQTDAKVLKEISDYRLMKEHYAAIGMVAATWAYFEAVMD